MRYRGLAAGAGIVAVLATGCSESSPGKPDRGKPDRGKEYPLTHRIDVRPGERFNISVESNASIGDNWQIRTPPDTRVAEPTGEEHDSDCGDPPAAGCGATTYFIFTAKDSGETTVELYNCFRGCNSESDKQKSRGYVFDIQVLPRRR